MYIQIDGKTVATAVVSFVGGVIVGKKLAKRKKKWSWKKVNPLNW